MHNASVGFHCPECVAEGRKQTRQGRGVYGGLRPARAGVVSMTLIGINAAIWLLILATGGATSAWVNRLALTPRGRCEVGNSGYFPTITDAATCSAHPGTTWVEGVATGAWWQPMTSMFTHVEIWHIGFNMVALWVLGPQLEMVLGRLRFTGTYLLSGLVGSAAVYWFSAPASATLGASGAIFGLLGALLVLAIKVRANLNQILFWIGLNFVFTVMGASYISWQGHLGGFVGGMALAGAIAYAPRERRTAWQAAGFGLVAVLLVLAFVTRTAALT
jgi:membrane associated rhomboid family serine protease